MPVSVLIVTRNRPHFLAFVLDKLSAQVRTTDQLVLVDDASRKSVSALGQGIAGRCTVTFLRHESATGCIQARNEGVLACANDCIVQLDDDSWIVETNAMQICEELLNRHPSVGAFSIPIYYHNARRPDECGTEASRWSAKDMEREYAFQGCGAVLRRSAVTEAGLYPEYYGYGGEEAALGARLHRLGYEVRMCRRIRVIHGHEQLSATQAYAATRDRHPSTAIFGNELCLASEALYPPFSLLISLIIMARAKTSQHSVKAIIQDFELKKPHLRPEYRLSLVQTLSWLALRSSVAVRNRVRRGRQIRRAWAGRLTDTQPQGARRQQDASG